MANDVQGNPWVIDTASATALTSNLVKISRMVWREPTTVGHALSVTDANSKEVWDEYAIAAGNGINYEREVENWVNGLIVPTLDSGTLLIYIR
jgi:hypothetical protein